MCVLQIYVRLCVGASCTVWSVWFARRAAMSELQAVLEFQVELFKFFNIDLFQRGSVYVTYYPHVAITYLTHTQCVILLLQRTASAFSFTNCFCSDLNIHLLRLFSLLLPVKRLWLLHYMTEIYSHSCTAITQCVDFGHTTVDWHGILTLSVACVADISLYLDSFACCCVSVWLSLIGSHRWLQVMADAEAANAT